ncbi:MAG: hypothetical protein WCI94_23160, partial [Rhodospirillales bacterium]
RRSWDLAGIQCGGAATLTIERYIVLKQNALAAMVYVRSGDRILAKTFMNDDELPMPEIGISIPLTGFYQGV